jgi:hypothetical protein
MVTALTLFSISALLALSTGPRAEAGSVFATVEAETTLGLGGTWSRVHPSEAGWWFFQSAGRDYWAEDLDLELGGYDDQARIQLTERGDLQDVQVERCPDGGWLVFASATGEGADDSGFAFRFTADFTPTSQITIEEGATDRAHNDMVGLCTDIVTGVAYTNRTGGGSTFFDIEGDAVGASHTIDFTAMGASLSVRESDGRIIGVDVQGPASREIRITTFETDWTVVDRMEVTVPEGYAFWPQRLLPYGDGWLVAYLARNDTSGHGDGPVWVLALDANFQIVDSVQVTTDEMPAGRPWLARNGDTLAVSYDREVQPRITLVRLASGSLPEDDGIPDTGPASGGAEDTASDSGSDGKGCGCAAADTPTTEGGAVRPLSLGVLAAGLLTLARRGRSYSVGPRRDGDNQPSQCTRCRSWNSPSSSASKAAEKFTRM